MKKVLVLTATLLAISAVFWLTLIAAPSRSRRAYEEAAPVTLALPATAPPPSPILAAPAPSEPMRAKKKAERADRRAVAFDALPGAGYAAATKESKPRDDELKEEPAESGERGEQAAQPTRAWFPETFLFEPLVVTDANGHAALPVKVPDRLTTWRVLALAHSRAGGQAGAVTSFLGTLPSYVEPIAPPFLFAGDSVQLPVQIVNTTETDLASPLALEASNAVLSSAGGAVRVPAGGNVVQYVTLTTHKPGPLVLRATLGGTDSIERQIAVQPAGRREAVTRGGTLAAPRTFELEGPAQALPGTESVRVRVFPGALGLVRAELAAAPGRGGVAEDAYLLQLLGQAPALLHTLGATPSDDTIRDLSILATQRVMRHARAPSVDAATLLTAAAASHPSNPVLERLAERLAMQIARAQRPDGTCEGATGWTLQRLLVTTADCLSATRAVTGTPQAAQRTKGMTLKASGAFERNVGRISDGYTAAAVLASGAVSDSVAATLRKLVLDNLQTGPDGAKYLAVNPGVVRADGAAPSTYEATALAILALKTDAQAPLADLGTHLLSGYSSAWGWGDGRANLVCLRAAVELFRDPLPAEVKVTVERDGKVLAQGALTASTLTEVLTLDADASGSSGVHQWTVRAEPPVPGLGYSFALAAYTPWKDPPAGGISLTTALPTELRVGRAADLQVTAATPAGVASAVDLALPAGVQADTPSLDGLVSSGAIQRYETEDGRVTLHVPPQGTGAVFTATVRVVPTLAGTLQAAPSSLTPEGRPQLAKAFAPLTWRIKQ